MLALESHSSGAGWQHLPGGSVKGACVHAGSCSATAEVIHSVLIGQYHDWGVFRLKQDEPSGLCKGECSASAVRSRYCFLHVLGGGSGSCLDSQLALGCEWGGEVHSPSSQAGGVGSVSIA